MPLDPNTVSPMTNAQHAEVGPDTCPFCRSTEINGDSFDIEDNSVEQSVYCLDCGAEWIDRYDLRSYRLVTAPTQTPEPSGIETTTVVRKTELVSETAPETTL